MEIENSYELLTCRESEEECDSRSYFIPSGQVRIVGDPIMEQIL